MKILLKASLLFAAIFTLGSCNLDLNSTSDISVPDPSGVFTAYSDAEKVANGANARFRTIQYGIFARTSEIQTDMFNASVDFGNNGGGLHRLDYTAGDYDIRDMWNGYYDAITEANFFLNNVHLVQERLEALNDKTKELTAEQKAQIEVWKGNCHFYRAYAYFQLVQGWSDDYEPSTAVTNLGVPIVLKFDVAARPARATVAKTYEQIESDITEARTRLAGVAGVVRSITPTIDVVNALDARVKLAMHKYAEASKLAGDLIAGNKYTLSSTDAAMTAEWVNDNGSEDIMQMFASLSELGRSNSGYLGAYARVVSGFDAYNAPYYLPNAKLAGLYGETDLRFDRYFSVQVFANNGAYRQNYVFLKYPGNPTLRNTKYFSGYTQKQKVFTIAEMYLIQAEAEARLGGDAATPLNALQTARKADITDGSMASVQDEWARETVGEGKRLPCLKRWHLGYTGRPIWLKGYVMTGPNYEQLTVAADDYRLTWPIPNTDMQTNANLKQNRGWIGGGQ